MKFKLFRPRSAKRDESTDELRYKRLAALLQRLGEECASEEAGLLSRYKETQQNASWALYKLEAEGGAGSLEGKIGGYEEALRYCETRAERLRQDRALFASLGNALNDHRTSSGPESSDQVEAVPKHAS